MEWAHTLRARLIAAAGGSIVVAVALFGLATVLLVRAELRSSLDRALRQRAQDVAQLAVSAPAVLTDPGALEGPGSGRQLAVQVVDSRGRILARSLTLGAQLLPDDRLETRARVNGTPGFEDIAVGGSPYRVYAAPIAQAGGPAAGGAVLVASDTSDISDTVSHLGVVLALSGAGAALLAVVAAALLTRRGLRPLRRLADAAGEIERTADPSRRLPESGVADEIGRLEGVLNRMLASLEQSRAVERRFLADASHELRTPVTALLGNVEFAARHGADAEVIADLERDAARLARLVDDLLVLERSGAAQQDLGPVDLAALVSEVVAAHPDGRVVAGAVEAAEVRGEADALARVLDNLVENGLVHGPPGGRVTVSVRRRGDVALMTVSDEGTGPSPEQHERMFERFWRGPDSAERPGSGLGLSIVSAIVERHTGRVTVDGSAFTVELALLSPVPTPPSQPGLALPGEQRSSRRPPA
ncbi:MAG TPA: HAMP domain-containing sensor histidine kinase [Solirubrobacteraceae bacterium]|nr:HAMP domain-containing sensor histidine kinase [Solirubrobacteraceae bacterium]